MSIILGRQKALAWRTPALKPSQTAPLPFRRRQAKSPRNWCEQRNHTNQWGSANRQLRTEPLFPARRSASQHGAREGGGQEANQSKKETDFFHFSRGAWFMQNSTLQVGKATITTEALTRQSNNLPLGSTGSAFWWARTAQPLHPQAHTCSPVRLSCQGLRPRGRQSSPPRCSSSQQARP